MYLPYLSTHNKKNTKPGQFLSLVQSTNFLVGIVFANVPDDRGSILGQVIQKTQKMVLDNSLLDTQHYKVRIKGKVEQSRERSIALLYTSV